MKLLLLFLLADLLGRLPNVPARFVPALLFALAVALARLAAAK